LLSYLNPEYHAVTARRQMKRVMRTSITIPKELLPEINREAKAKGRNRSSYIVGLILADLKRSGNVNSKEI